MRKGFLILGLIFTLILGAQPPSKYYSKFGGNGDDVGYSAKPTLDRQYIVAGSTSSYGNGYTDVYLVKVDSMGYPLISKEFGGFGNEAGKSVIQLPDSGYIVAGYTNSFGAGGYDAYLVRTDKNLNLIWQQTFGGPDWDFASDVVQASDGNIVVVGNTSSFGAGNKDGFVIKYDLSGNLLWQKFFGGAQNEELRSVIKTNDNFLATVGYTESKNDINGDGYFLKLDLNGDTLFTRTYGGSYLDYANDLVQKSYGDYILCGAAVFYADSVKHSTMRSYSDSGSFLWENSYAHGAQDVEFLSVANSNQMANLTAYSRSLSFPAFGSQGEVFTAIQYGWVYLINASGGAQDEFYYSIEGTSDGGYVCVGSTTSFGSFGTDVYFVKLDSTIINYSSAVGIAQVSESRRPLFIYSQESVQVDFYNQPGYCVEIFDLYGIELKKYFVESEKILCSLSGFEPSVYIIRVTLKNGQTYTSKFLHK